MAGSTAPHNASGLICDIHQLLRIILHGIPPAAWAGHVRAGILLSSF